MAVTATFVAYIDESGDEGFKFGAGSSRWFILSAVVLRRANELREVKLIDEVRSVINANRLPQHQVPDKHPLHFRDLKHDQRRFYVNRIARADLCTVTVLIDKHALNPREYEGAISLYHHAVRLMVERISWYCRDCLTSNDEGDGSVHLIFSNRATMDYQDLQNYLQELETNHERHGYEAEKTIIRPDQIETYTSGRRMGFQLADAVASSYFFAVEPNLYEMTEESYLQQLRPCAYHFEEKVNGYGAVFHPVGAEVKWR